MSQFSQMDRLTHEAQRLFIGTGEVYGLQNVNYSYDAVIQPLKYLGAGSTSYSHFGSKVGSVSTSVLLIGNDQFINYTGDIGTNGYLLRSRTDTNQNMSFVSGYLSSYSSRCSIGQIPQIDAKFDVFSNIGSINSSDNDIFNQLTQIATQSQTALLHIAGPGSISINLNEFTTNRVQNYDLQINVPRNAYYILGQVAPKYVKINWPVEITLNFQIDKNDYSSTPLRDYIARPKIDNLALTIADYDTSATIVSYAFNNMVLASQSLVSDVKQNTSVNLQYRTFLQSSLQ